MSPSRIRETSMSVTPLKHAADKKCEMGATITGLDLNDISDEDLEDLRAATHKYQLVLIKDQQNLDPVKHWELISRLDPTAPQVHGHGTVKDFQKTGGMLAVCREALITLVNDVLTLSRKGSFMVFLQLPMFAS
jgi:alpha-ketoglutarate-dependent taurine dioxygenase